MRTRQHQIREIQTSQDRVIAGLEEGGFDKRTTLVIGGSALAFAGIRPAQDLDIMVTGEDFKQMETSGKTPGGLNVVRKPIRSPFLETQSPTTKRPLAILTDITFPFDDNYQVHPVHDKRLENYIEQYDKVAGYSFLPPSLVAAHKESLERPRYKDRRDIRTIARYLAQQRHVR